MKLLICLITYNRLEYTQKTLINLFNTISTPSYLVVVDNKSSDGTRNYLKELFRNGVVNRLILNKENFYPGKACNIGWERGLKAFPEATHLMRLDNDMHFKKGWDVRAKEYFERIDRLGQLGLDYDGGENKTPEFYNGMGLIEWPSTVGGPCIIRREIWDNGARYDETPWEGTMIQEDVKLSHKLQQDGWLTGHMDTRLSWTFATPDTWKKYPDYYKKTMTERGQEKRLDEMSN